LFKEVCFFDRGGMDGWGAKWKKHRFSYKLFVFERNVLSTFGKYGTSHLTEERHCYNIFGKL
jgi:hypothetical protein